MKYNVYTQTQFFIYLIMQSLRWHDRFQKCTLHTNDSVLQWKVDRFLLKHGLHITD